MTLKLTDIRKKLPFKVQETCLVFHVSDILGRANYKIDYDVYLPTKDKNLQRDFCWTDEQKSELIFSLLKGIKLTNITVIMQRYIHGTNRDDCVVQIIDGKQRLSTILSFIKNEFPIIFKGEKYFFNDLDDDGKYALNHSVPNANISYEWFYDDGVDNVVISDDDKIAWFELINFAGTPQDVEHLNFLKQ